MVVVYVFVFILIPGELSSRAYFAIRGNSSFWWPDLQSVFYRELQDSGVLNAPQTREDGNFNVLLLGGSVLAPDFGKIDEFLAQRLNKDLGRTVKIYNLARAAHSSRDSLNKYLRLSEKRFDLVLFYHAINESRMNNVPPDIFRTSYIHASWYARLDALKQHFETPAITLFYALHYLWIKFGEKTGLVPYLPKHVPPDSWLDHGSNIRTDAAFRGNLSQLINNARKRGDPLLIVTFATYLPGNYNLDKPYDQQPEGVNDYHGNGLSRIEAWGQASNVISAVAKHNSISRQLGHSTSKASKNVIFADLDATFPRRGEFFIDVTHFSLVGQKAFVNHVAPLIVDQVERNNIE